MEETHAERRMRVALDTAENELRRLKDKHTTALASAEITRHRWDEPAVTLIWVGTDGISRSISATTELDSDMVEVFAGAWVDDVKQDGLRRYAAFELGKKSACVIGYVWRAVEGAYLILSSLEKLVVSPLPKETIEFLRKQREEAPKA